MDFSICHLDWKKQPRNELPQNLILWVPFSPPPPVYKPYVQLVQLMAVVVVSSKYT